MNNVLPMENANRKVLHDSYLILALVLTGALMFLPSSVGEIVSIIYKVLMVLFFLVYVPRHKNDKMKNGLLGITLLFFGFVHFFRDPSATIFSFVDLLILILFCSGNSIMQRTSYELFRKIFIGICFLGIIVFIGFVILGISPLTIDEFYEEGTGNQYYNYGVSIILVNQFGFLYRLCGLFNEPGMFGTFAALILIAEQYNYKKIGNWIIFIAGIFSFSLAFWALLVISVFCDVLFNRRKSSIIILSCIIIGIGSLATVTTKSANFDRLFSRVALEEGGKLAGDQRTSDEFDAFYDNFKKSPEKLLFGSSLDPSIIPSSYKRYIVQYGLILTLMIFIPLFISIMRMCKKNKWAYILTICFFVSIYQRPLVIDLIYFVILVGGIQYILYCDEMKKLQIV